MTVPAEPTPAELRALAADTVRLADRIRAAYDLLGAATDGETRSARYRLAHAASTLRESVAAVTETAEDLERIRAARGPNSCGIPFGVCPEHGNTLTASGGSTWCTVPRCGRTWTYDRATLPCTEPITHRITDTAGSTLDACNGHALDAEQRMEGGTVTRIAPIV